MNYFNITSTTLEEMAAYKNMTPEDLMQKSIAEILQLNADIKEEKAHNEALRNAADEEYIRLVKKYFTPFAMLAKYFKEEDIIIACSNHLAIHKLTDEYPVPKDRYRSDVLPKDYKPYGNNTEYIGEKRVFVPRYAKNPAGEQLLIGEEKMCYVYRITAKYQGLRHGDVILELLYKKHPELKQFGFEAYEYRDYEKCAYEIYPKNHIYTPLEALLTGDIDAIRKRNIEYAKSYNAGTYTPDNMQKILESDEIKNFFDVIAKCAQKG